MRVLARLVLTATLSASCAPTTHPRATMPAVPSPTLAVDWPAIDESVSPCTDFARFACGRWSDTAQIPPGDSSVSHMLTAVATQTDAVSERVVMGTAPVSDANRAASNVVRTFAGACLDVSSANADLTRQLERLSLEVDGATDTRAFVGVLAHVHNGWGPALFDVRAIEDLQDRDAVAAALVPASLTYEKPTAYLTTNRADAKSFDALFVAHVVKTLELAGVSALFGKDAAQEVLDVERTLARGMKADTRGDTPAHLSPAELAELAPRLPWAAYLAALGIAPTSSLYVTDAPYLKAVSTVLDRAPSRAVKTYLKWQALRNIVAASEGPLAEEAAAFAARVDGEPAPAAVSLPRSTFCMNSTRALLGELVTQLFSAAAGVDDSRVAEVARMTTLLRSAIRERVAALPWMDAATRQIALQRLDSLRLQIARPTSLHDQEHIALSPTAYVANIVAVHEHEAAWRLALVGKAVKSDDYAELFTEEGIAYRPQFHLLQIPASALLLPLFDPKAKLAVRLGGLGERIAHKTLHALDATLDPLTRPTQLAREAPAWWSAATATSYGQRAQCVVDQFVATVPGGTAAFAHKKLLENAAELGGIRAAFAVYKALASSQPAAARQSKYTDDQLFFLAFGQDYCGKQSPQGEAESLRRDKHLPPSYRVNGVVSNTPEFAAAFQCKPTDAMVHSPACGLW